MTLRRSFALLVLVTMTAVGCGPRLQPAPQMSSGPAVGKAAPLRGPTTRQFTYTWRYGIDDDTLAPRGGTSHGPDVRLDTKPSAAWERLRAPDLSARERDRRAILAMAGTFRTTFDFLEVIGFGPASAPDRPYQSWGTEYVHVVRDEPRLISLQHLLVMFMRGEGGKVVGPFVTKHWRQDWTYEDAELLTYRGHLTWGREHPAPADRRGTWTQAVFQVDDSPRYEASGRWEHFGNVSSWQSGRTWRPLPRREWSVRKDYDVLIGTNRVTITPTGWVYEEDNLKTVLGTHPQAASPAPVVAKEIGFSRYERIVDFDDSAGRQYQERTEPFWAEVRAAWADLARRHPRFTMRGAADKDQLFVPLFEYAQKLADGAPYDPANGRAFAREAVEGYVRRDAPLRDQ